MKSILLEHMPDQMEALLAAAYADLLADALNLTSSEAFTVANADSLNVGASSRNSFLLLPARKYASADAFEAGRCHFFWLFG